jgi:hypothetical protein
MLRADQSCLWIKKLTGPKLRRRLLEWLLEQLPANSRWRAWNSVGIELAACQRAHVWKSLREEFQDFERTVLPFSVPSPQDVERFKLSILTFGRLSSPFRRKLAEGEWIYSMDTNRRELLEFISFELGFAGALPNVPRFMWPQPLDRTFIEASLRTRQASPEFTLEWGRLKELQGRYFELIFNSDKVNAEVEQAFTGKSESTLLQRHWYARWISANSKSLAPKPRRAADESLGRVCNQIRMRRLLPPAPYPLEWFERMLERENGMSPGESLKTTYTRLTRQELSKLLADTSVTDDLLPPLRAELFDFPAHRRGRAAQQSSHRSGRSMYRNASRYLLAFRERQRQSRATPRSWTNPTVWRHLEINRR